MNLTQSQQQQQQQQHQNFLNVQNLAQQFLSSNSINLKSNTNNLNKSTSNNNNNSSHKIIHKNSKKEILNVDHLLRSDSSNNFININLNLTNNNKKKKLSDCLSQPIQEVLQQNSFKSSNDEKILLNEHQVNSLCSYHVVSNLLVVIIQ